MQKKNTHSQKPMKKNSHPVDAQKKMIKKAPIPKLPSGWLVFSKNVITIRDFKDIFPPDRDVELWPDAGVMELSIGPKQSLDLEVMEIPEDPDNAEWFSQQGIQSLFYLTFDAEAHEQAFKDMKQIASALGVRICGDTDDLTPVIE